MQVLVCDDEPDIRLLYRSAFEAAGAQVTTAGDGLEAVERAVSDCPDLIVLDLRMPRCDGATALPQLKLKCPGADVVVVSAHLSFDHFSDMETLGARDCFDKMDFLGRIPGLVSHYASAEPMRSKKLSQ
ncbi:MAG: two-component system, response regulator, stage 0 sporulation protein [Actinomycetota bacterium]|jgi:two-component system response regulator (stage 0 sporulation protein F)|nr:two-component system, response regulator, stage 0 sporulation protein [Actinomycetota bacterium]